MTARVSIAAVPIVSLVALMAACGGGGAPSAQPSPATQASSTTTASSLTLDATERGQAIFIAINDPQLRGLIGDIPFRVEEVTPWVLEEGPDSGPARIFGAMLTIAWEEPLTLEFDWPAAPVRPFYSYWASQTELPPFDEQAFHYTASGVTGMIVDVDLDSERVVGMRPEPYAQIEQPPIATRELTQEEKAKATQIAGNDPRIQELLSTRDYSVRRIVHWFLGERSLGAGMIIDLSEPQPIESDWPYIDVDDSGDSYTPFTVHFTAPQVERLDVLIDLQQGQVAGIVPIPGD